MIIGREGERERQTEREKKGEGGDINIVKEN